MFNKRTIKLKKKLAAGESSPGLWMYLPSPTAAEIAARSGLDWVVIDAEHATFNPETLLHMVMAFHGSDTVPMVRVPWNDHVIIKQVLDMGWDGVVVPQVNTAAEARKAVAACRYAPLGKRGYGPVRAGDYGRDEEEYARLANDSVFCLVQVEDVLGIEREAEEIVQVPGIDGIFVGRKDMSSSVGSLQDGDNPRVWNAIRKLYKLAREAGIPTHGVIAGADHIEDALQMGSQLICIGVDTSMLIRGIQDALSAHAEAVRKMSV